jgi:hypothetical protein
MIQKAVAALGIFSTPCNPAMADKQDFYHTNALAFFWGIIA